MAEYTTIDDPTAYFQVDTYTGTSSATDSIVFDGNSDLQPDLLWAKSIETAYWHQAIDSTRGAGTGQVYPNVGNAEGGTGITSFDSDGWTGNVGNDAIHDTDDDCVCFAWKANAGTTTSVSASGSGATRVAASTYQVDTTSKFSICGYTGTDDTAGATITHGLGVVPEMILVKCRNEASTNWTVYHHKSNANPQNYILELNSTAAASDNDRFNDTAPTSTVFSVNADSATVNANGDTYIAYCFAGVQGYSKFGSFVGNGNADGAYVHTGFKPAWILMKEYDDTAAWGIWDHKRTLYNPNDSVLLASAAAVPYVGSSYYVDLLSNGFKMRTSDGAWNGGDDGYIYAAFASEPFVTSSTGGSIPTTAK
jgi:hypothetical protein